MTGRAIAMALGAAVIAGAAAAPATAGRAPTGARPHPVNLVWTTISTDVGSGSQQEDLYRSTGLPFGRSAVTTEAPRGRRSEGVFDFEGVNARGRFLGRIAASKTYIISTNTRQVIDYRGYGQFEAGRRAWSNIRPYGRITFRGRADCTPRGLLGAVHDHRHRLVLTRARAGGLPGRRGRERHPA
jgi:hypothetical protein